MQDLLAQREAEIERLKKRQSELERLRIEAEESQRKTEEQLRSRGVVPTLRAQSCFCSPRMCRHQNSDLINRAACSLAGIPINLRRYCISPRGLEY